MSKTKYICAYDLETSGRIEDGGQPIELAALLLDIKTWKQVSEYHTFMYLEPGETMSPEAETVHGYSAEMIRDNGISRSNARVEFLRWLENNGILAPWQEDMVKTHRGQIMGMGHNIVFDTYFMRELLGLPMYEIFTYNPYDTLPVARLVNDVMIQSFGFGAHPFKNPETGYPSVKLEHIAASMGRDVSKAHGAMWDIRTTVEIYKGILHQLGDDLKKAQNIQSITGGTHPGYIEGVFCPSCCGKMEEQKCIVCGKEWTINERTKNADK